MCGRIIQSSRPLPYAIVDGMSVRDSRVHRSALLAFGKIGKSQPQAIGLELSRSLLRLPTNWSPTSMTGCLSSWRRPTMRGGLEKNPTPRDLMRPIPSELMRIWPISTRVNKPENDDPSIVEPIELAPDAV